MFALRFLAWSRESPTVKAFHARHTLWHVVSSAGLAWLAHIESRGNLLQPPLGLLTAGAAW